MHEIELLLGNTNPADGGTDVQTVSAFWEEAERFLSERAPLLFTDSLAKQTYSVRLDASDVRAMLASSNDRDGIKRRFAKQEMLGRHPMSASLIVKLDLAGGEPDPPPPVSLLGRFLQQLFLAMNLGCPGSLGLFSVSIVGEMDQDLHLPRLSSDSLEFAFTHALQRGWPPVRIVPFEQCWRWLHREMIYEIDIAESPAHRALFTILRIASTDTDEADTILLVVQALEGLMTSGRDAIGSTLRQRIELVLGEPATHKGWFSKLYERRSRIAHGTFPMLRPGGVYNGDDPRVGAYIDEFFGPLDEAISVLLGVLQALVTNDAQGFAFLQSVRYTR